MTAWVSTRGQEIAAGVVLVRVVRPGRDSDGVGLAVRVGGVEHDVGGAGTHSARDEVMDTWTEPEASASAESRRTRYVMDCASASVTSVMEAVPEASSTSTWACVDGWRRPRRASP